MSKPVELAMYMLCKHMQVVIKSMWHNGMFIIFSRILNLPFNIPKVRSIDIVVLDCIKLNLLCILVLHLSHFGRENKTMATLDK
jgi:hypothetical protein